MRKTHTSLFVALLLSFAVHATSPVLHLEFSFQDQRADFDQLLQARLKCADVVAIGVVTALNPENDWQAIEVKVSRTLYRNRKKATAIDHSLWQKDQIKLSKLGGRLGLNDELILIGNVRPEVAQSSVENVVEDRVVVTGTRIKRDYMETDPLYGVEPESIYVLNALETDSVASYGVMRLNRADGAEVRRLVEKTVRSQRCVTR